MRDGKLATVGGINNVGEYFEEYVGALVDEHVFKNDGSTVKDEKNASAAHLKDFRKLIERADYATFLPNYSLTL